MQSCVKYVPRAKVALFLAVSTCSVSFVLAQAPPASTDSAPAKESSTKDKDSSDNNDDDRILGIIPNFLTVENPQQKVDPLTARQKFALFAKETFDPFTGAAAAAGAALSQIDNDDPKYGHGAGPYAERFGAAVADITTQNFFSDAVLASLLHEDPRYFRKGQEYGVWHRVGYALSRVAVTRTDGGATSFNYAGVLGMGMGIGLSNAYYPEASVSGKEVATRFGTSFAAAALGNLLPEFWPDIHERFFHRKPRAPSAAPATTPFNGPGD